MTRRYNIETGKSNTRKSDTEIPTPRGQDLASTFKKLHLPSSRCPILRQRQKVTSSYVYIRLVLVTLLAGKIQCTIFYIAVFPTVSKMYAKGKNLALFFVDKYLIHKVVANLP